MKQICTYCTPRGGIGIRHLQIFLVFFMVFICYAMRTVLSVAIVAMTDKTVNPSQPTYDWDDTSIILSSFYWGYIVLQIPSGYIAERFGIKWLLLIGVAINTIFFLLIPFLAPYGSWLVMLCRILQGLSQGVVFPSIYYMLGKWAPAEERAFLTSFALIGMYGGTVVSMPVTGLISASSLGWPFAFYLFSFVGLVWIVLWFFFGSDSPRLDSRISEKEMNYIEESLKTLDSAKKYPVPYRSILTSPHFWATTCMQTLGDWGYTTFLTNLPTYMNSMLQFEIGSNSLLSAAPYLIRSICAPLIGILVDWTINQNIFTVGVARKLASSTGAAAISACLICLGALQLDSEMAVLAVTLAIASQASGSFFASGHMSNLVDLSPKFAATMMSITNTISTLGSIFGPLVVQFIVTDNNNASQWSTVFYLSAALQLLGMVVFIVFASGNRQTWDDISDAGSLKSL